MDWWVLETSSLPFPFLTLSHFKNLSLSNWHFLITESVSFHLNLLFLSCCTLHPSTGSISYASGSLLLPAAALLFVLFSRCMYVRVNVLEGRLDPDWPPLHHCFLMFYPICPSVRLSNQLSLCVPAPARVIQVDSFTPVITGEDVGYPATLAFRRTSRLVRLMTTCCSLSVSPCASRCRYITICSSSHLSENPSASN